MGKLSLRKVILRNSNPFWINYHCGITGHYYLYRMLKWTITKNSKRDDTIMDIKNNQEFGDWKSNKVNSQSKILYVSDTKIIDEEFTSKGPSCNVCICCISKYTNLL